MFYFSSSLIISSYFFLSFSALPMQSQLEEARQFMRELVLKKPTVNLDSIDQVRQNQLLSQTVSVTD